MEVDKVEALMCEYLMNVEHEAKIVLGRLEEIGQKIDDTFVNHFVGNTIDRFKQACESYSAKEKLKDSHKNAMTTTITPTAVETEFTDASNGRERKRKAENVEDNPKRQKLIEPNLNDTGNDTTVNKEQFKYTDFVCVYCVDSSNFSKSCRGTINDVYEHWLTEHHANKLPSAPFKFYAIPVVNCFHCNEIGSYYDLVKHHKEQHEDEQFAIVEQINLKQCGICHVNDTDLLTHFKLKHDLSSTPKVFNPIYFSEEKISDLLAISVHKQCKKSRQIFNSDVEALDHNSVSNGCQADDLNDDNSTAPAYLICDFCHENVDCNSLLNHFRMHTYEFHCSQCPFQSDDISELIIHENSIHKIDSLNYHCSIFPGWIKNKYFNTNMVFSNGLTLKMYNVLETKYDESKSFDIFLEAFVNTKKKYVQLKIELNEPNENSNDSDEQIIYQTAKNVATADVISSPDQFTTETNGTPVNDELMKQRKLARNIFVHGISDEFKVQNLYDTVLKLCRKLRLSSSITGSSIEEIEQCKDGLIVKFFRMNTKKLAIRTSGYCWSNDLLGSSGTHSHTSRKVYIRNHMTPFYQSLYAVAAGLKRQKVLFSYKLGKNGLVVQRDPGCQEKIVNSEKQLLEFVGKSA
ncbi:uncharacterized protein LOC116341137 [Contarinia nasturtii]|uniref:uncharacterized protein LOC116341137 n=1 Tax=Contarinia nasturtii TaxID=265458 RepID=UPI0012D40E6C|nr:uncharacterized protein LOC116341137 [Contarinia nasturtii]